MVGVVYSSRSIIININSKNSSSNSSSSGSSGSDSSVIRISNRKAVVQ